MSMGRPFPVVLVLKKLNFHNITTVFLVWIQGNCKSLSTVENQQIQQCSQQGIMQPDDMITIFLKPKFQQLLFCYFSTIKFQEKISEANPAAHTFEYLAAAEVGRALASIEKCELRYSCPLSGDQLKTIFNEAF